MKKADKRTYMGEVTLESKPDATNIFYMVKGSSGALHPVSAIGATVAKNAKPGTPFKLYITSNGVVTYYELARK
jgi:hypothetical protein